MKQSIANYTILIEKDKRSGTNKACYTAYVPLLGIATDADTLEEAQSAIASLINFHLESLVEEGEAIPVEKEPAFVTRFKTILPKGATIAIS